MRLLLLGGTELTLAAARVVRKLESVELAGVVAVPARFDISYAPGGVRNARHADIAGWGADHDVPVIETTSDAEIHGFVDQLSPDFGLAAGWYHMVGAKLRARFPMGVAGLHASLLPALRGGAPLNWAVLLGMEETGITLFRLADGVDTGPVYGARTISVGPRAYIGELVEEATRLGLELLEACLPRIAEGTLVPQEQVGEPSYCLQRSPDDGAIDWKADAHSIERLVRAVSHPYPGAFCHIEDERLTIWRGAALGSLEVHGAPGQLFGLPGMPQPVVVTGQGCLRIDEVADAAGEDRLDWLRAKSQQRLNGVRR